MSKYINADDVYDGMRKHRFEAKYITIGEFIDHLPSADVKENIHGEWQITDAFPHNVYCSECHERFAQTHWAVWEDGSLPRNFCPNCGADMRGKGNEIN